MMFLTEANLLEIIQKQFHYKLKAYIGFFLTLIGIQIIAVLFSANGIQQTSTSFDDVNYTVRTFSSEIVMVFTLFWSFIVALFVTTKTYRNMDFAFVSNRLSSNMANIGFIAVAAIIGGLTVNLSSALIRVIMYYVAGSSNIAVENFFINPTELLLGTIVAFLYILLVSSVGYIVGVLTQINKLFVVILPALLFGNAFLEVRGVNNLKILSKIINFFAHENSIFIFTIKVIIVVLVLFLCAILLSDRMEVKKC